MSGFSRAEENQLLYLVRPKTFLPILLISSNFFWIARGIQKYDRVIALSGSHLFEHLLPMFIPLLPDFGDIVPARGVGWR